MKREFQASLGLSFGIALALALPCPTASAQPLTVYTLAGRGAPGMVDASGFQAQFNVPSSVGADGAGNLYLADTANHTVRKIGVDRSVSTFAGQAGNPGATDGLGTNAQFYGPQGIAVAVSGNVYVADTGNSTIRKITSAGVVSTIAGAAGISNSFDGPAVSARFYHPQGLAVDPAENLYVADTWNHTIRRISSSGEVTTVAGLAGNFGAADGSSSKARFQQTAGIALDSAGNLYVADSLNHSIRKITPAGSVTTIAGLPGVWGDADGTNSGARFFHPQGIVVTGTGDILVADSGNHSVRKISVVGSNWVVSTVAGLPGTAGDFDGTGSGARFYFPAGLALDGEGDLFLADSANNSLRTERVVQPVLQFGFSAGQLLLCWPAASVNFTLEKTASLSAEAGWVSVTNRISTVEDTFVLTNATSSPAVFYRLHQH